MSPCVKCINKTAKGRCIFGYAARVFKCKWQHVRGVKLEA